ncbi:MAG TPA: SulP family inorganic anion transporter [Propionibacteriaceae bacterium]|nr:SulP family inorganic anion transporter [Propionibacteriaceae bacterium]
MAARPLLASLAGYQRDWLAGDLVAALTLTAIAVPEQMATAHLVGVPAATGLWAFIVGSVVFALVGRHHTMSVGADSTIAPMIAAGALAVASAGSPGYRSAVALIGVLAGVLLVVVGAARLGWVAQFLSRPAMTGVLIGIALEIAVHQLPALLGLPGADGSLTHRVLTVARELGGVHPWPVVLGLGVLVIMTVAERIDGRIPGALIGVGLATLAVIVGHLDSAGVAVLGGIDSGLPHPDLTAWTPASVARVGLTALTVAFVCVMQTATTEGAVEDHAADLERDVLAIGIGSLVAGAVGSFGVDSSPPRTQVLASSRARSQLAGLVAAALVLVVLLVAAGALRRVPEAALAGVLLFVAGRLFRVRDLLRVLRFDRTEFATGVLTVVAVVVLGIEQAIIVAMALSLALRVRDEARPRDTLMGQEVGTDHWIPTDISRPTRQVPGLLVYLVYAPLWYANAAHVVGRLRRLVVAADPPVRALVIDVAAMPDLDFTGAAALRELIGDLHAGGVRVAVARASHRVHHELKHAGLLPLIEGGEAYLSVEEAVEAVRPESTR